MNVIKPLIDLQDTDGLIRDLEGEAKDIPQRKAQETARLAGVNATLEIAKSQLAAQQKRIKDEETEAAELRAKAQDVKISQASIRSNKELQQSIMQVEGLERDATTAEDRALALQDDLPQLEKRVADAQARVDADQGGVDGYVSELDARLREVNAQLEELRKERVEKAAAVRALDPRALLYYERISTRRWPAVAFLNSDGVCDGCHMKQPPYVVQNVDRLLAQNAVPGRQELPVCTMCGRILYRD